MKHSKCISRCINLEFVVVRQPFYHIYTFCTIRHYSNIFGNILKGKFSSCGKQRAMKIKSFECSPQNPGISVDFVIETLLTQKCLSWCQIDLLASGMLCYGFLTERLDSWGVKTQVQTCVLFCHEVRNSVVNVLMPAWSLFFEVGQFSRVKATE